MPRAKRSTTRRTGSRPSRPPGLSTDRLREIYYFLKMNRLIEERLSALYRQGKVQGGLYSSRGQEAISVGSAYALGPQDILAPMIRNLGAMLVKGVRPLELFLQYLQREGSPCKGRDTSLHFGGIERGLVPPISHLGTLVPVMAGVALAARRRGKPVVALTYVGDGASHERIHQRHLQAQQARAAVEEEQQNEQGRQQPAPADAIHLHQV